MSRARDLANSADNDISGTLTVDDITLSGNITVGGTVDGRDLATDGSKLDGVEANADVTDVTNVTAAGALMESAVTNLAQVKAFDSSDYATAAQGATADAALPKSGGTMTGSVSFAAGQTFDGRDLSADGAKLDGIESGATADQTKADIDALNIDADTLDGQHGSYYTGYADTAVANLVDSAPGTLDTLNELAAALGDDPNFSTTVTNNIATKLPLAGGTMTGAITFASGQTFDGRDVSADGAKLDGIESGATADQTASEILTAIKTVDGSGSGLNADQVDGVDASSFLRSDANDSMSGKLTSNSSNNDFMEYNGSGTTPYFRFKTSGTNNGYIQFASSGVAFFWNDIANQGIKVQAGTSGLEWYTGGAYRTVWHSGNDGSGSGLDADTLDGYQASSFHINSYSNNMTCNRGYADEWWRSIGSTGWYNETYAGGIYMTDTTWVRVYNSRSFYVDNQIAAAGNVTAYYSDERLKTKTGDIEGALDKIKQLNGFYYVENDLAKEKGYNNDKQQVALSAQEVEAVMPEAVSLAPFDMKTLEDGTIVSESGEDYLTVDYARLVPLLVEAIKELKAEIEELKNGPTN